MFRLEPGTAFCHPAASMSSSFREDQAGAADLAPREFPVTRWSQVMLAGDADAPAAAQALDHLCHVYWPPIYGFLRRKGFAPHDAEDLTQQFFFRLLQHNA